MAEREKQNGAQETDEQNEQNNIGTKPGTPVPPGIIEQDPNDIPRKGQSQVPDVNQGKVHPGHRDREQV